MLGFLIKVGLLAALVVGGFMYISRRQPGFTLPRSPQAFPQLFRSQLAKIDPAIATKNLSAALDSLVTHPGANSPVVLGLKVSHDSLGALVDVIERLPPDQISQLKSALCQPATSSGR